MASISRSQAWRESTWNQRQQTRLRRQVTAQQLPQLQQVMAVQLGQLAKLAVLAALVRQDKQAASREVLVALAELEVVAALVVAERAAAAGVEALPHPVRMDKLDKRVHPVPPECSRMAKTVQMVLTGPMVQMAQRAAKAARVVREHATGLAAVAEPVGQHHNQDHSQHRQLYCFRLPCGPSRSTM